MVDGAARGNPGEAGRGAAIHDDTGVVVKELSRYLGHATNNVAEYEGPMLGLEALLARGRKKIVVQSDSFSSGSCTANTALSGETQGAASTCIASIRLLSYSPCASRNEQIG